MDDDKIIHTFWRIYLGINILFLLPSLYILNTVGDAFFPLNYIIAGLILYYICRLTYVNIAISSILMIYFVRCFLKDRKIIVLVLSVLLVISDILLNCYWLTNGGIFLTQ